MCLAPISGSDPHTVKRTTSDEKLGVELGTRLELVHVQSTVDVGTRFT